MALLLAPARANRRHRKSLHNTFTPSPLHLRTELQVTASPMLGWTQSYIFWRHIAFLLVTWLLLFFHHYILHIQTASPSVLLPQPEIDNITNTSLTLPTDATSGRWLWDPGIRHDELWSTKHTDALIHWPSGSTLLFESIKSKSIESPSIPTAATLEIFESTPYSNCCCRAIEALNTRPLTPTAIGVTLTLAVKSLSWSNCCRVVESLILLHPNPTFKRTDAQRHTNRDDFCYWYKNWYKNLSIHPSCTPSCTWNYTRQRHPSIRPSGALSYGRRVGIRVHQHKIESLNFLAVESLIPVSTPSSTSPLNTLSTVDSNPATLHSKWCCRAIKPPFVKASTVDSNWSPVVESLNSPTVDSNFNQAVESNSNPTYNSYCCRVIEPLNSTVNISTYRAINSSIPTAPLPTAAAPINWRQVVKSSHKQTLNPNCCCCVLAPVTTNSTAKVFKQYTAKAKTAVESLIPTASSVFATTFDCQEHSLITVIESSNQFTAVKSETTYNHTCCRSKSKSKSPTRDITGC